MKLRKLGKKGGLFDSLSDMILAVVVIIAIIAGIMIITPLLTKAATIDTCRSSVLLKAKANINIKGVNVAQKITPLACKTTDAGTLSGTRDEIKQQIAELGAKCWYQYVEGTITDLFSGSNNERSCAICYYFRVDELQPQKIPHKKTVMVESARTAKNISIPEFYNYIFTQTYNPGVFYGGGTKVAISDIYKDDFGFDLQIDNPRIVSPSDINSKPFDGYVVDYSGYMLQPSRESYLKSIKTQGDKLLSTGRGQLLVLIADKFDSMDRVDSMNLVQDLNLNSNENSRNAILLMVDINNHKVRLTLGADLEPYISEYEISDLIKSSFASAPNLETALSELVQKITSKIIDEKKNNYLSQAGINLHSYYAYFSTADNYPLLLSDFEPGKSYAVAYASSSQARPFFEGEGEGLKEDVNNLFHTEIFNPSNFNTAPQLCDIFGFGFCVGGIQQRPNNLIISRANDLNQYCKVT